MSVREKKKSNNKREMSDRTRPKVIMMNRIHLRNLDFVSQSVLSKFLFFSYFS